MAQNNRDEKRSKEINSIEVKILCDCGNEVLIKRGAKAFYCPGCGSSKLMGQDIGIIIPSSDFVK